MAGGDALVKPLLVREPAQAATHTYKVRREQAEAVAKVLADAELARQIAADMQVRADHLCAGVLVGLVPDGAGVVSADVRACRITVRLAGDDAPIA